MLQLEYKGSDDVFRVARVSVVMNEAKERLRVLHRNLLVVSHPFPHKQ